MRLILILGGTAEARELADLLVGRSDWRVVTSLRGATPDPAALGGAVRIGPFGGVEAMTAWLRDNGVAAVIDASHPFAARISANADEACARAGVPRLQIWRPAWCPGSEDKWQSFPSLDGAAMALPEAARVFLTIGGRDLAPFRARTDCWYLVRAIVAPAPNLLPKHHELVLDRGPFALEDECRLMRDHGVGHLVTKNSGGTEVAAKLRAAREVGARVFMVDRPAPRPGPLCDDIAGAMWWLETVAGHDAP